MRRNHLLAACAAFLALASVATAQNTVISVNIARSDGAEDLTSGQAVGASFGGGPVGNWNNVLSPSDTPTTFTTGREVTGWQDSTGAIVSSDTGFSFFIAGNGGDIGNSADDAPTRLLRNGPRMQGYGDFTAGAGAFSLTNTAAIFGTNTFDLYVYGANPAGSDRTLSLQLSGTSDQESLTFNRNDINTTFTEGEEYLVFTGLTAASGTIAFDIAASGSAIGFGGFQMVGAVVPEPSTYAMIAGALALVVVMVRRRK